MDMVLAKINIAIASRYAELVDDPELREAILTRLRAEWQYTIEMLLAITGQQALLDQNLLLVRCLNVVECKIPAFLVAERCLSRLHTDKADAQHLWLLLRVCCERPRGRAAERG